MSRCFPFPPPGYSLNTSNNEALIESIKLQREKEIAKAERKKEKKEKKERKREKKSKESSKHGFDKSAHESKGKYSFKCPEEEAEQLERSNLTEEHGQAVCPQNSSCSSDSTQNSNKRKRPASPSQASIQGHGSIIRIRLTKKGGQSVASTSKENQLPKPALQDTQVTVREPADRVNPQLKTCQPIAVLDPSPSTSGRTDWVGVDKAVTASCSKLLENRVDVEKATTASKSKLRESRIECQYRNLIEMLPSSLPTEHLEEDDQLWLFQRKPKHARVEEKHVVINETTSCGSSSLWPRAHYIPEAEIYALPFTVPF